MFGLSFANLKLIGLLVGFIGAFAAGGFTMHKLDDARYQKRLALEAQVTAKAEHAARAGEQRQTAVVVAAAGTAASHQERIITHTVTLTQEIHDHVPPIVDTHPCVPWGFVRLHDAAAWGVGIAETGAPAGEPDDACAPFAWADVAAAVVQNYGTARQNAQQLDDLEQFERDRAGAFNGVLLPRGGGVPAGRPGGGSAGPARYGHLDDNPQLEYNTMAYGLHIHVYKDTFLMSFNDQVGRAVAAVTAANAARDAAVAAQAKAEGERDTALAALNGDKAAEDTTNEGILSAALDGAGVPPFVAPVAPVADPAVTPVVALEPVPDVVAAPATPVVVDEAGNTDLAASGLNEDGTAKA